MSPNRQAVGLDPSSVAPGLDVASIREDFARKLFFQLAKFPGVATTNDHFLALSYAVSDRVLDRWVRSSKTYLEGIHRTVLYLSAEYLMGPQLVHNLQNLGIEQEARAALNSIGLELDELVEHEEEPGLGNGGLGRLAACFMDSLATLEIPAIGHGLRYEFGIFDQEIRGGAQVESADLWLRHGNPWEVRRFDIEHVVGFGGHTEHLRDADGRLRVVWHPERVVRGVPYDTPVLGRGTSNAGFLRLWSAAADRDFDLDAFQVGDYWRAVDEKIRSENLTKVLYPNDDRAAGKQLRFEQQYFFVSCALQDAIRVLLQRATIREFATKYAVQLNDTHPTLAVPELMRLLMDVHGLGWDEAWSITTGALSYTNHTLMPEALEAWSLPLFRRVLPRHLEIVFEINRRFLEQASRRFPGDHRRLRNLSIIGEDGEKQVRMANLATVASHSINGVAALHSKLLRTTVLRDFAELWPERFTNVTNGVTPRRFLALANPRLASLLDETIGQRWREDLEHLSELQAHATDPALQERWRAVKLANKRALVDWLRRTTGQNFDPEALLAAQCKRIHEYKRQHLNLLHVLHLYRKLRSGQQILPRTVLLAGKAAPGYTMAKLIIRLTHALAETIRKDARTRGLLTVVFAPDFNVKNAQRIYPAADVSEQISTAGHEASGTGNIKFAMNGALTIGTLDGANVEIRDAVGPDHFFLFGLTAKEVMERRQAGYDPGQVLAADPELDGLLREIADGGLSPEEPQLFRPLVDGLRSHDPFLVLADFRQYVECQERLSLAHQDPAWWTAASIRNVAAMAPFSSDRSIREYAERIWRVQPISVR